MARETLQTILEQISTLDHEELRQLRHAVEDRLTEDKGTKQREGFHRALLSSGLVKRITKPSANGTIHRSRIEVKGVPVSETIIEERR